jgi:OOP family OmpA-OmpF porin
MINKKIFLIAGLVVLSAINSFAQNSTSKNKTEPLWWINPNNYVYSELNEPKHAKQPKIVLPDSDGDGIPDQFDLEPNTPAGVKVDSRGRALDTDGDGVPDYLDKELLTPQKCFPVNKDGVGTCPENQCCSDVKKELQKLIDGGYISSNSKGNCSIASLPSVQFKGGSKLGKDAETILASAAAQLKANPTCKVKVIGYGATSKAAQQLSYDKVSAVIKYLVEKKGIAENRVIFVYGQDGDPNTVDLQPTTEEGPNSVPAPHPNLKGRK